MHTEQGMEPTDATLEQKIAWIKEAAGTRFADLELSQTIYDLRLDKNITRCYAEYSKSLFNAKFCETSRQRRQTDYFSLVKCDLAHEEQKEKKMRKYMGFIVVAVFLLSISVGVFWNEIIQVDAITIGVGIICCLLALFFFLYTVGQVLFYGDRIDWSQPNVFVRPFLPPFGSEKPHRLTDQNELERQER